ncbi:MAG: DUF5706 domain-containing protein [Campylobacteraceae bacterium]|jgi:hypothetical protein|nr:DUF5706 domain-containing protein [Campylobacteraceae bacterium]
MAKLQKNELFGMLDRVIGFIRNCDNKVAVSFAFYGVILTIIFTNDGVENIKNIVSALIDKHCAAGVIFTVLLACGILAFSFGIYKMIKVLQPRTDTYKEDGLDTDSKIFFEHIAKLPYKQYKKQLLSSSNDEFLNDLISQIYINSKIADEKYKYYKSGLIISIRGFIVFMILWGIGMVLC